MHKLRHTLLLGLISLVWVSKPTTVDGREGDLNATVKAFNETLRSVRASHPLLAVNYIEYDGSYVAYSLSRRFARLARGGGQFHLEDHEIDDSRILLEFKSRQGTRVDIDLYSRNDFDDAGVDEIVPMVLSALFEFGTEPTPIRLVAHTESGLIHHQSCNHLPRLELRREFVSLEDGKAAGLEPCRVCFPLESVLPFDDYTVLRVDALESARTFELVFPLSPDVELQSRLERVGQKMLDRFPVDLVGFDYQFRVVESGFPNAFAFPTGFVYVTDSLMRAIESPGELEFVVAHEIAHCELLSPPVGIGNPTLSPLATEDEWEDLYQQRRFLETGADLVAFHAVESDGSLDGRTNDVMNILRKLQYVHEPIPAKGDDRLSSHPPYATRLNFFDDEGFTPVIWEEPQVLVPPFGDENDRFEFYALARARMHGESGVFFLVRALDSANKALEDLNTRKLLVTDSKGERLKLTIRRKNRVLSPGSSGVVWATYGKADSIDELTVTPPWAEIRTHPSQM